MDSVSNQRPFSLVPWFVVWLIYAISCELLKSYDTTRIFAGGLIIFATIIIDLFLIGYSLWLARHATAKVRLIFSLFFGACLFLLGVDSIYHVLYNLLNIPRYQVATILFATYNLLYVGCLVLQILMWGAILSTLQPQERKSVLVCIPFTVIILAVLLFYIFMTQWNPNQFTLINFYDGLDEILELFSFVVAVMCLITAKNKGVTYLAIGYFIIRMAGFAMDFHFFSQAYGSSSVVEFAWMPGTIFMIYALAFIKKNELYSLEKPWVELPRSLRSQIVFWGVIISVLAFTVFTMMAYFFQL